MPLSQALSTTGRPEGSGAAMVEVATNPGTSRFHGTAFEFLRNDVLNANNRFLKREIACLLTATRQSNPSSKMTLDSLLGDRSIFLAFTTLVLRAKNMLTYFMH